MKKKFGELLLERGLITPEQLADALALQRRRGMRLGAALVANGHMTETQLVQALGSVLHIPVVDLTKTPVSLEAVKLISARFAEDHELFPYAVRKERGRKVLSVAMSDPLNYRAIDELSFMTDSLVEPVLARSSDIDAALTKHYAREHRPASYGKDVFGADLLDSPENTQPERTTMTIMRKAGVEETVDVHTGKVVSPFIRGADGALLDNPAVNLPKEKPAMPDPLRGNEISAVLLTEEVEDSTPLTPMQRLPPPPPAPSLSQQQQARVMQQRPAMMQAPTAPMSVGVPHAAVVPQPSISMQQQHASLPPVPQMPLPMPQTPVPAPVAQQPQAAQSATNPYFDDALGALLDSANASVNAEEFVRLERKFWALMRLLAKKGLLSSEEFMKELGEE